MARVRLRSGHDVVVPQFLGRLEFVHTLQRLGQETGAEFIEVAQLTSPEDATHRFTRRSADPG